MTMTPTAAGSSGSGQTVGMGGSTGGSGPSHAAATGVIVGDGKAFVPDDINMVLVDMGRAMTILTSTLVEDGSALYWVVSARNDEPVPLCDPQINAAFSNPVNTDGQAIVSIRGAMHQWNLYPVPCLQPGEVGMGAQQVFPHAAGEPKTFEIDYQPRGFLAPETTKLPDLSLTNVKITSGSMGSEVTGRVSNLSNVAVSAPELTLFPLDSGGRPYDFGYDSSSADLAAGASWNFHMTIPSSVGKYVAFPVYGQQNL